jgi:hypothetical protein
MVKVTIEVEADEIIEVGADIIAEPGDRIVVARGKALYVLPAATANGHAASGKKEQAKQPAPFPVTRPNYSLPSDDAVYAAIEAKPDTTRRLNARFGFGSEDEYARNYVRNRVAALVRSGRVRPRTDDKFPVYEVVKNGQE